MEVFVIDEPDVETSDPLYQSICALIGSQAVDLHKQFIANGETGEMSPHFDLMQIASQMLFFREQQRGFETILAEASADDSELTDTWLTVSNAGKALDSIYHQLFNVVFYYTEVICQLNEDPEKCGLLAKHAQDLIQLRCESDPNYKSLIEAFKNPSDISAAPGGASHHLQDQVDDQQQDAEHS